MLYTFPQIPFVYQEIPMFQQKSRTLFQRVFYLSLRTLIKLIEDVFLHAGLRGGLYKGVNKILLYCTKKNDYVQKVYSNQRFDSSEIYFPAYDWLHIKNMTSSKELYG